MSRRPAAAIRQAAIQIGSCTPAGAACTFRQRTEISPAQAGILDKLGIDPPPRIYQLIPAVSR